MGSPGCVALPYSQGRSHRCGNEQRRRLGREHDQAGRYVRIVFRQVWASRGKAIRAEPVSALYEQGRVHHVGAFQQLEDQMCAFTVDFNRSEMGYSPDRVDALVWALTELMIEGGDRRLLMA